MNKALTGDGDGERVPVLKGLGTLFISTKLVGRGKFLTLMRPAFCVLRLGVNVANEQNKSGRIRYVRFR